VELYVDQFILFLVMFARISSMLVTAPMFGHQSVPAQMKAGLSVFIAFVLFVFNAHQTAAIQLKLWGIVVLVLKEILTGASIGFAVGIIFAGVRYAGEIIGTDMGFSMAMMYDPESNTSFPVLGEMLYMFLLLIFILMNGHHFILEALQLSYKVIPIGTWGIGEKTVRSIVELTGQIFVIGVKISAPLMVSLFLANISLGILNKAMPQMNIFGVIFPLKIGVGILVLSATIPLMAFVFKKILTVFESSIIDFIHLL
jgi:flagellar biosynthetic protein FliR